MEGIQMAQMLADLSDINASESRAAKALVNANKHVFSEPDAPTASPHTHPATTTTTTTTTTASQDGLLAPPKRPADMIRSESHEGRTGRTASPYSYNLLHHRRMLTSPPMSRCASTTPSVPGTPRRELEDDEADKAATIMRLYESRAKLRQHHNNDALSKARDAVNDLVEMQKLQQHYQQRQHDAKSPALEDGHRPLAQD